MTVSCTVAPVLVRPVCFSIQTISDELSVHPLAVMGDINESWHLADESVEAFSRLLPLLACGEESAIHVFFNAAMAHPAEPFNDKAAANLSALALMNIAQDEMRHEAWLTAWRNRLPTCLDHSVKRQARKFFAGLASDIPAVHFTRIAALDSAVCQILAALMTAKAPLFKVNEIKTTFDLIRKDEARHVRISRAYATAWGATPEQICTEWHAVRGALATLLERVAPDLAILGANPEQLFGKLKRLPEFAANKKSSPSLPAPLIHPFSSI